MHTSNSKVVKLHENAPGKTFTDKTYTNQLILRLHWLTLTNLTHLQISRKTSSINFPPVRARNHRGRAANTSKDQDYPGAAQ